MRTAGRPDYQATVDVACPPGSTSFLSSSAAGPLSLAGWIAPYVTVLGRAARRTALMANYSLPRAPRNDGLLSAGWSKSSSVTLLAPLAAAGARGSWATNWDLVKRGCLFVSGHRCTGPCRRSSCGAVRTGLTRITGAMRWHKGWRNTCAVSISRGVWKQNHPERWAPGAPWAARRAIHS
jgi:hypothetical protein